MLTSKLHFPAVSCPLSLCLVSCSFSRVFFTESFGPSRTFSLARTLHPKFWAKFFLRLLLLAGRNNYGTENRLASRQPRGAEGPRTQIRVEMWWGARGLKGRRREKHGMSRGLISGSATVPRTANTIPWAIGLFWDPAACCHSPTENGTEGKTCSPPTTSSPAPAEPSQEDAAWFSAIPHSQRWISLFSCETEGRLLQEICPEGFWQITDEVFRLTSL